MQDSILNTQISNEREEIILIKKIPQKPKAMHIEEKKEVKDDILGGYYGKGFEISRNFESRQHNQTGMTQDISMFS